MMLLYFSVLVLIILFLNRTCCLVLLSTHGNVWLWSPIATCILQYLIGVRNISTSTYMLHNLCIFDTICTEIGHGCSFNLIVSAIVLGETL